MSPRTLITGARLVDPQSGRDEPGSVAIADGRIVAVGRDAPRDFHAERSIDASGAVVAPGLVDLCARLGEPGHEHEAMLESEMAAAVAGGVTSLVCPPDTDPVLDEPGLVEMLKYRARSLDLARLYPLGALTRGLAGEAITEMAELTEAGCIGFGQADVAIRDTLVLHRALQYAATFGYTVWLRPNDAWLGNGVAAKGPLATRMGLSGVPVLAETIALETLFELVRDTGARVHLVRLSSAAGVELVRAAKAEGLPVTCDASIHQLHLIDVDIGYFDAATRLVPPLRQQRDRDAIRRGLGDGTIDALVSDHTPVADDAKQLPFAEAEPGATGLELLLGLALKWGETAKLGLAQTLAAVTSRPAAVIAGASASTGAMPAGLVVGAPADLCIFDAASAWQVEPSRLKSRGTNTPFAGHELHGVVRWTLVAGRVAYEGRVPDQRPGLSAATPDRPGMRRLRAVVRLLRCVLHGVHGLLIVLFRFPSFDIAARQATIRWWSLGMLRRIGITLRVEGEPAPGGGLLVANHVSWLDIMVIHAVAPDARFVSKADVQSWPLVSRLIDSAGTLYIAREKKRDARRVVATMAGALAAGQRVAIFPEGTTSTGHGLLPFHANLLQAAVVAQVPVQPAALRYSDAHHAVSVAVEFIGATTLAESLWRSACGEGVVVRLAWLAARPSAGLDRRALARLLRADIASALGVQLDMP